MADSAATFFSELGISAVGILALVFFALLFSSYVKIVTVLGMIRIGLGLDSVPAAFLSGGVALTLSYFVMYPVIQSSASAIDSTLHGKTALSDSERAQAINAGIDQWKKFLIQRVKKEDAERFQKLALTLDAHYQNSGAKTDSGENVVSSWRILAPAFLVSELKDAFSTGLAVYLPFLVIDLLAAVILVALGLDRLNPILVSFPFKLSAFVLLDDWSHIVGNLIATYS